MLKNKNKFYNIKPMSELQKNATKIAKDIMVYSRDQLMMMMPFLNRAFFQMPLVESEKTAKLATDGKRIYYNVNYVIEAFKQEKESINRAYLHMVFHCVFSHPFNYDKVDREMWDLAADIAVENAIMDLKKAAVQMSDDDKRKQVTTDIGNKIKFLTAEKIYSFFKKNPKEFERALEKDDYFFQDSHRLWVTPEEKKGKNKKGDDPYMHMVANPLTCGSADDGGTDAPEEDMEVFSGKSEKDWEEIGEGAKMNLETFMKDQGKNAGALVYNLEEALKEKVDYTEFLKKFAVTGEEMHINDDEFDYIYYTYGLKLYDNMPLIEPLEYRENKRIKDFVIAIDTSGSCQGSLVRKFLDKTYSILTNEDAFFKKVNIHIIQCDSEIQQEIKITSLDEFEAYIDNFTLAGFGGTDFRPVFKYVDELIASHEFDELKGLIYFTDGRGTFPARMPNYPTAFVFLEDGFEIPQVPSWAIRLVLDEDDIEEMSPIE